MVEVVHDVLIRIRAQMQGVQDVSKRVASTTNAMKKDVIGFRDVMGMSLERFRRFNEMGAPFASTAGRMTNRFRMLTHGMRGFRMEMLSVMFFGMGLQRFFMGLLKPAADAVGIFKIFSVTLQVLFLPIMLAILPFILALSDWFMNLPEGTQVAIGAIALVGLALGWLLGTIGSVILGLGGLTLAFGGSSGAAGAAIEGPTLLGGTLTGLKATIGSLATFVTANFAAIASVLGQFVVWAVLIWGAWENNTKGISAALGGLYNAFWKYFGNILFVVQGAIKFITAIFNGDAKTAFQALKEIAQGTVDGVIALFTELPVAIWNVLQNVLWGIGAFVFRIVTTLYDLGQMIMESLARGIEAGYTRVIDAVRNTPIIGEALAGGMDWLGKGVSSLGKGIGDLVAPYASAAGTGIHSKLDMGISPVIDTLNDFKDSTGEVTKATDEVSSAGVDLSNIFGDTTYTTKQFNEAFLDSKYTINGVTKTMEDWGYGLDESGRLVMNTFNGVEAYGNGLSNQFVETSQAGAMLAGASNQTTDEFIVLTGEVGKTVEAFISAKNKLSTGASTGGTTTGGGTGGGGGGGTVTGTPWWINPTNQAKIAPYLAGQTPSAVQALRDQGIYPAIRYMRLGGLVTKPTLALLGEGGPERVTPIGEGGGASMMTIAPNYYINASVSSDMDIRKLASRLNEMLTQDYRRLTYR